ncbi:hypothetical protein RBH29_16220 [Herbivorax sp. ANBcel31]|uniref:hypothetical protein n=1 Tax=Herbivorax sp. ANBcel31 TaxID=3069754 RepID=UPI0027B235FE|nr:hypothetical protein [Herbivorax sp. ANBcel31]MDQ2087976.1 hypothetical protein [Herbivorax sp. ANBcel31]
MHKKKKITLILIILVFILIYLNYNKYQIVKEYDEFTKNEFSFLSFEKRQIVRQITNQTELYRTILEEGHIKKGDAASIVIYFRNNKELVPDYLRYANNLRKQEIIEDDIVNEHNMIIIGDFFVSLLDGRRSIPREEKDDILVVLDDDLREKIEYLNELNDLWMNSLERNLEWIEDGELSREKFEKYFKRNFKPIVLQNYWIDFVSDLEKDTREFLAKYNVDDIKELLQ